MRYCQRFLAGIPHFKIDIHALLTRPPLPALLRGQGVRLACVRHAASVYPEPGSNSSFRLNLSDPSQTLRLADIAFLNWQKLLQYTVAVLFSTLQLSRFCAAWSHAAISMVEICYHSLLPPKRDSALSKNVYSVGRNHLELWACRWFMYDNTMRTRFIPFSSSLSRRQLQASLMITMITQRAGLLFHSHDFHIRLLAGSTIDIKWILSDN